MGCPRWLVVCLLSLLPALTTLGQEPPPAKRHSEPLYPMQRGNRWEYRVTDAKAPARAEAGKKPQMVIIVAESEQVFSIKKKKKDQMTEDTEQVIGFNLQVEGGGKVLQEQVLVADDGVYRVSGAGKAISPPLRIFKKDARKGAVWECNSQSENAQLKGSFVADEEIVTVPAGTFNTVVVRSRDFYVGAHKMQSAVWYAPKVGMVKQHIVAGTHDVTLELTKFEAK